MRWGSFLLACFLGVPAAADTPEGRLVDLTYSFDEETIYWPTEKGFVLEEVFKGVTDEGYYYMAHRFRGAEHGGTHIDAPAHFYLGRKTVDEIPLEALMGEGVVVDVSGPCGEDRDYLVAVRDFEAWERRHGRIPKGAFVFLRTGFGRYWPDRERYLGTDQRGQKAVALLHFPGLHPKAAEWIATARAVKGVGIDTASIDHGPSERFESHVALFRRAVPVFENVANLDRLPAKGFSVIALPMKIRGGSGGPVRIVAQVRE